MLQECPMLYQIIVQQFNTASDFSTPFIKDGYLLFTAQKTGGRLNKKDGLTRYGDSHVKDKTS